MTRPYRPGAPQRASEPQTRTFRLKHLEAAQEFTAFLISQGVAFHAKQATTCPETWDVTLAQEDPRYWPEKDQLA